MLKSGRQKVYFYRDVSWSNTEMRIADTIKISDDTTFDSLQFGDEFFVRYVPQSRYFQHQEFDVEAYNLTGEQLYVLNTEHKLRLQRTLNFSTRKWQVERLPVVVGSMGLEYSEGRKRRVALTYRLRRRADEVVRCIRLHYDAAPVALLDLGPAEGKALSLVQDALPHTKMTGLEFSPELIDACVDDRLYMV